MHIAHHITASRYTKWHRWLGGTAAALAAVVGTSIFATLANDLQEVSKFAVIAVALVSMLSAGLSAAATFLNLDERGKRHLESAADFQRLRREMDEELVSCTDGKVRESYDTFKDQWHKVLRSAPPLPQDIHDRVNRDFEAKHGEKAA